MYSDAGADEYSPQVDKVLALSLAAIASTKYPLFEFSLPLTSLFLSLHGIDLFFEAGHVAVNPLNCRL